MIRLFVALDLPDEAAEDLGPLQRGMPGARWSSRDKLHITLRFAGEIPEALADDLDSALSAVVLPPFPVTLAGAGSFGDARGVNAIWAGVEASPALTRLRGRCESAARGAGLAPDTRSWKPHVTLAYLNDAEPGRVAAWIQAHTLTRLAPFEARSFGLYSSRLSGEGSIYRLERSYPLRPWPRDPSAPPAG